MLPAVFAWRHTCFILEYGLEVCLTGKAEIVCDLGQTFIGVTQKTLGVLKFGAGDIFRNAFPGFAPKLLCNIGSTSPHCGSDIINSYLGVCMIYDILNSGKNFFGGAHRKFCEGNP